MSDTEEQSREDELLRALSREDEQRKQIRDLEKRLRRAHARKEELSDATREGVRAAILSMGPLKPVQSPKAERRSKGAEVALWHLTDWQGSKVTPSYNSEIMRRRVMHFCEKAARLTEIQRSDHPVKDCTIMFGGDLIEGLFNYPTQPFQIDSSLFRQYVHAGRVVMEAVRYALTIYERVTVVHEWGNHGRIGSKRAAVPESDNVDRMIYWLAHEVLLGQDRLTWEFEEEHPEDIQHVEIGKYRALLIHGDEIGRNGFASRNTIVQACNRWGSGAHPWAFKDVFVGHYHGHNEDSLANGLGSVYWTGSTESDNRYANDRLAASARPTQRLHFVDPHAGRTTAQYKVWLD